MSEQPEPAPDRLWVEFDNGLPPRSGKYWLGAVLAVLTAVVFLASLGIVFYAAAVHR